MQLWHPSVGLSLVCTVWVLAHATFTTTRRHMSSTRDSVCNGAVSMQVTAASPLDCFAFCAQNTRECAAVTFRPQDTLNCRLHPRYCLDVELETELGSTYSKMEWDCSTASCYYLPGLQMEMMTNKSLYFCADMNGHNLAVETEEEQVYIANLIYNTSFSPARKSNGDLFPVRLNLIGGVWKHTGETPLITAWYEGARATFGQVNCAGLIEKAAFREWAKFRCNNLMVVLCEIDL